MPAADECAWPHILVVGRQRAGLVFVASDVLVRVRQHGARRHGRRPHEVQVAVLEVAAIPQRGSLWLANVALP